MTKVTHYRVPLFRPLIEREEEDAAASALRAGWLGMGGFVRDFEQALAGLIAADERRVVAVNTGHSALHLALLLAGISRGDEVITPSFNNVSDLQAIATCGADVVLCDVDDRTLCADLDSVEALVSDRTKAVIVTDYACHLCDHSRLNDMAEQKGFRVIHDAAHSFGGTYNGDIVGSFSDITMFSFDPIKTVTCIDGGAVIVRSDADAEMIRESRFLGMQQSTEANYGHTRAATVDVARIGFRYHMANLHAAIGLAQLSKLDRIRSNRRHYFGFYETELADIDDLHTPGPLEEGAVPFLYYARVPAGSREAFREHLRAKGVESGLHWKPGHHYSFFENCRRGPLTVTERVGAEIVSLPLHSDMSDETLSEVVSAIRSFWD